MSLAPSLVVHDPATGEVVAEAPACSPDDARRAVGRAAAAMREWSALAPRERAEALRACWAAMLADRDRLADLIVAENGKPRRDADSEVVYAAEFFRWCAEEAVRLDGELGDLPGGHGRKLVMRQPIGVVLCVTPWNLPAAMLTRKVAPALAAGCAVVCKPAPATPLTALAIAELMAQAGVPDGLVAVLPTLDDEGLVRAVLEEPAVRKLSFTGSTATGSRLLALAAPRVVSCAMELGGNAPFVVLADADLDVAVDAALVAKLRHNSEACTAANRFLVAESIAPEFADRMTAAFEGLQVGPGSDEATDLGPLIDDRAVTKVAGLVDDAVAAGASVRCGGERLDRPGSFYAPTVLADVGPDNPILDHEVFGPVAPIVAVPDEDDDAVIALANATDLGLASYVCGRDLGRALRIAERLEAGMVGINRGLVSDPATPFGGVKASGIGREGGHDGVLAFTEPKLVVLDW
jgi:succinate-semialdehyde dehydrogenase / glutarate-semialdehyde dehydrogenase